MSSWLSPADQETPTAVNPDTWTVQRVLTWSAGWLKEKSSSEVVQSPRLDVELLLAHVLACDRMKLYLQLDRPLTREERDAFKLLLRRRVEGEPIPYIVGYRDFYRHRFTVTRDVLIPRADTETLVECSLSLSLNPPELEALILDVGTGSGCVAISLACSLPNARVIAWDISEAAVKIAQQNADDLKCTNIQIELCDVMTASPQEKFSHITSNPPYIARSEESSLAQSVKDYEPHVALFDDVAADGLSFYRLLAKKAMEWLIPGGTIAVECGHTQAQKVHDIFAAAGLTKLTITKDLAGIDRVVSGYSEVK
jgi:release factor glutamine methyltransferase